MIFQPRRRSPLDELTDYLGQPQSSPAQAARSFGAPSQSPLTYSRPTQNMAVERSLTSARPPQREEPQPVIVEVDGLGRVEFGPEFRDMSPDEQGLAIEEILSSRGGAPAQQDGAASMADGGPLADWGRGGIETITGAAQGAGRIFDNAAELAQGAYNNTLGRVFGESQSATQANQQGGGFQGVANQLPEGNRFGRFLGEAGASALLTRGLGGPVTQGAATGALVSDAQNTGDFVRDVAVGGAGGWAADRLVRGAQRLIAPTVQPGARELADRGVRMTPGQVIGGRAQSVEDMATSFPYLGGAIEQGRRQSFEDFNRAAVREVADAYNSVGGVRPITVPTEPGRRAVAAVGNQLSQRYEALVPRLTLLPDQQLATDVSAAAAALTNGNLSPSAAQQLGRIMQNQVTPLLNGRSTIPGPAYRQVERRLGAQIARYGGSSTPDDQAMAETFREIQSAFQRALQRSNPRYAEELGALNSGWANLVRVETAAGSAGAKGGVFSPAQFRSAVRSADNSVRGRAYARGEARMQQLADAADEVLPRQYPDSGTAGRLNVSPARPEFWGGLLGRQMYGPEAQQRISNFLLYPRGPAAQSSANFLGALPAPQLGATALNFNPIGSYVPPAYPRN